MSDKPRSHGFLDRWSARKRDAERRMPEPVREGGSADLPDVHADSASWQSVTTDLPAIQQTPSQGIGSVQHTDGFPEAVGLESEPTAALESSSAVHNEVPVLTDEDMPPIESLSSDSDLSGFFNKGVSAALRKAALRHVFQQPVFNVRDGLNDYDGDYTVFEPLGDTVTSDMKWHIARKERERVEALEREEQARLAMEEQSEQVPPADQELSESDESMQESSEEAQANQKLSQSDESIRESDEDSQVDQELSIAHGTRQENREEAQALDSAAVASTVDESVVGQLEWPEPAQQKAAPAEDEATDADSETQVLTESGQ